MGVDIGGGLVVRVSDDLHGDERVDAGLVEHGHVVVPEIMRRDDGPDALQDVVLSAGVGLLDPPCRRLRQLRQRWLRLGLAQWTYHSRKQALLEYAKAAGTSIGDLAMQLGFLCRELESYASVLKALKGARSVREASDVVLKQYEKPADQGESVQKKRASYGQTYYDKYAGTAATPTQPTSDADGSFMVKVKISNLNIRSGPGTNYARIGKFTGKGTFEVTEVADGEGSKSGWGKLKSGEGWIALDYAKRI